jgi:hypothetical protein
VHLTVGVLSTTWYDVLQDALSLAADDPAFRDALPLGGGADVRAFLEQAAAWAGALPVDAVQALVDARAARAVPVEPVGMLAQAATLRALDATTVVRPRAGLRWTLTPTGDRVVLTLPDRVVDLPAVAEPPLRRLLAGPLRVADLEGLDLPGSLVLVRRMLTEGVLVGTSG